MVKAYKPESLKEAVSILSEEECTIFSGGTDLMVKARNWSGLEPRFEKKVIFIGELDELKGISLDNGYLEIGAACTFSQLLQHKGLPELFYDVFEDLASPSIRNIATLGGNICNSSPAGDSLPLLYAIDSVVRLESLRGVREVAVSDFITGPGRNVLSSDEIMTSVRVPIKYFTKTAYRKVGTRKSTALSKLSFTGLMELDGGTIRDIRICFGAVGPTVVRNRELERQICLASKENNLEIKEIKERYSGLISPISDQRSTSNYRRAVSLRLLDDFLKF